MPPRGPADGSGSSSHLRWEWLRQDCKLILLQVRTSGDSETQHGPTRMERRCQCDKSEAKRS